MSGTPLSPDTAIVSTAGSAVGADDLWCSKALDLLWMLPRRHNWDSPSLQQLASPHAVRYLVSPKNAHRSGAYWVWFWRVNPTVWAWISWAMRRAGAADAAFHKSLQPALYQIRDHLESRTPGICAEAERTSPNPPPIPDIPVEAYSLALCGELPRWGDPGVESRSRAYGQPFAWKQEPTGWYRWYADRRVKIERQILSEIAKPAIAAPTVEVGAPQSPRQIAKGGSSLF